MLELYHYEPYANSMKCLIALREKNIPFTSRYVDILKFEQHEPWFVRINPNGQVPALVHDGRVVVESTVINEYLDDVFTDLPLRPADPGERAKMRIWSKWVDEILMPTVSMLGWQARFRPLFQSYDKTEFARRLERIPLKEMRVKWQTMAGPGFSDAQLEESRRQIRWFIARMEEALRKSPWLAGPSYTLADINAYPMIEGVTRLYQEIWNEKDSPRSIEWLVRINERPAVRAAFAYSRFKNAPGEARDAEAALRA
ncbi:MAG TPA: glutathione S-transferase family protein [Xanthobacteraceae bacterium]|jgi:glutathione S-transferase